MSKIIAKQRGNIIWAPKQIKLGELKVLFGRLKKLFGPLIKLFDAVGKINLNIHKSATYVRVILF